MQQRYTVRRPRSLAHYAAVTTTSVSSIDAAYTLMRVYAVSPGHKHHVRKISAAELSVCTIPPQVPSVLVTYADQVMRYSAECGDLPQDQWLRC